MNQTRPITLAIAAMGGQGGGVLTDWLIDVAEHAGYYAQSTSVPGVAQRTGATIYYLEFFPRADAPRPPVLALMPVPGDVDIVLAAEWLEAGRAIIRGIVTPDRTTLIASRHREYSYAEKMVPGDGRVDPDTVLEGARSAAKRLVCFDMEALAQRAGSVISSVLLGALAGAGVLPFSRAQFEDAIRRGGVAVERNLAGFAAGLAAAQGGDIEPPVRSPPEASRAPAPHPQVRALLDRVERDYPQPARTLLIAGVRRLVDYQDPDYARVYLDQLDRIRNLEPTPVGGAEPRLLIETARYLALWMSYEDTIRIADLKIRPQRFARYRADAAVKSGEIAYVSEFLHPRLQEVCDTLPAALGRYVLDSPRLARVVAFLFQRGRRVRTATVSGFLLLYAVAALRPLRRLTLRYRNEHDHITRWLGLVASIAPRDYALAVELAECPRLVKGYGDTHARGLANYQRILDSLQTRIGQPDLAARVREWRAAALADEHGALLTAALQRAA